mgnify:CR=1 FL=1
MTVDKKGPSTNCLAVTTIIYPRSPREQMAGWAYLPRFIDKIRLSEVGQLHEDYQSNYLHKGFDAKWLETSGLGSEEFVEIVKQSTTDGQLCDWVRENVEADYSTKELFNDAVLNYGSDETNTDLRERLAMRKKEAGMGNRDDIQCFVDFIDADEGRL